jgi:hypothetical protein
MEPIRPKVDRLLFNWITNQVFNPKDFFETREGVCRVSQGIIGEIIPLIQKLDSSISNIIKLYAKYFKNKMVIQKPGEFGGQQNLYMPDVADSAEELVGVVGSKRIESDIATMDSRRGERVCLECGLLFRPTRVDQKFCCATHTRAYTKRLFRNKCKAEGKCQVCGKPMPEGTRGVLKEKISYCPGCAARMKRYYAEKKAQTV